MVALLHVDDFLPASSSPFKKNCADAKRAAPAFPGFLFFDFCHGEVSKNVINLFLTTGLLFGAVGDFHHEILIFVSCRLLTKPGDEL